MIDNPYYTAETHGPFELFDLGDLVLAEGATLPGAQLAYTTHGELNETKDNAILVTTWYSGNHSVMEQLYIGPEHALNPDKYFIAVVNQLGSGLGSSPHNTPPPYGRDQFPRVRIGDDVVAQERLLRERFGISELALVVGGSMGAEQAYEWAIRFPERVKRAAPIAGTARTTPHGSILPEALIHTMTTDEAYAGGRYEASTDLNAALQRHARLMAVTGFSAEFWNSEYWRGMGFNSIEEFTVGFLEAYFAPMDVGDLLCQAWKWQHADVGRHANGDLRTALGRITAKTFVMPISSDLFFPVPDCAAEQGQIADAELRVIDSICGHLALFHLEPGFTEQIDRHLGELLDTKV